MKKLIEIEQVLKYGRQVVLSLCTCSIEFMCADKDVCETLGPTEYRKLPVTSSDPTHTYNPPSQRPIGCKHEKKLDYKSPLNCIDMNSITYEALKIKNQ